MRKGFLTVAAAACAASMAAAGCAAAPRARPLPTAATETGPESLTAVRKQLQGQWMLTSMVVHTPDGKTVPAEAVGQLDMDGFGNLSINYRLSDESFARLKANGIVSPNPTFSASGAVLIDTQQQLITYAGDDFEKRLLGFDPELAAKRANPFALERVRSYAIQADGTLRLATRYDDGKDAIVTLWKRGV